MRPVSVNGMRDYSGEFYEKTGRVAGASASVIVPLLLQLIDVRRVVDVGCGTGEWLRAFMECGVKDVLGVDGEWVASAELKIPPPRFARHDLRTPLRLGETFDLVVSLETAEHLPEAVAGTFVESLTGLGPVVLFSGAIPFQGGTGHVNEQWPDYWAAHFRRHGYVAVDCLRRQIWNNQAVAWYYAQNLLLFVEEGHLKTCAALRPHGGDIGDVPLSLVHPRMYLDKVNQIRLGHVIRLKLSALKQAVKSLARR
jgi:SAM-dependent methyltransferase